jgi:acetyl esterase/lipase
MMALVSACSGTDLLNAMTSASVPVRENIRYGDDARNLLDIYVSDDDSAKAPLLLFIHGGSWQDGSKNDYRFVGQAYAARGVTTAVMSYRTYPPSIYPAFVEDAAAAIAHMRERFGRERPLFVMGHSAGAHIGALALADPEYLAAENVSACAVDGFIGLAGPYDFALKDPELKAIFPPSIRTQAKPVNHANGPFPPALLLHGTDDRTVAPERTRQMAAALTKAGNAVETRLYSGVDHTMIMGAVAPLLRHSAPTFEDALSFMKETGSVEICH